MNTSDKIRLLIGTYGVEGNALYDPYLAGQLGEILREVVDLETDEIIISATDGEEICRITGTEATNLYRISVEEYVRTAIQRAIDQHQ